MISPEAGSGLGPRSGTAIGFEMWCTRMPGRRWRPIASIWKREMQIVSLNTSGSRATRCITVCRTARHSLRP